MRTWTATLLQCPSQSGQCAGSLKIQPKEIRGEEVHSGLLECQKCGETYPILSGIAIVVPYVADYILEHVKGISRYVQDEEIPQELLADYLEAKAEIPSDHIEEDLEAERVNALYLMNHYLSAKASSWWRPLKHAPDPLIERLILENWDKNPLAKISQYLGEMNKITPCSLVELGCGVGGLGVHLGGTLNRYVGIDSAFASIAIARNLALKIPGNPRTLIPEDLLRGGVSREVEIPLSPHRTENMDYLVGDVVYPPLKDNSWDLTASLNMIDMLDEPEQLPILQNRILKQDGLAIQSSPYIWPPRVAENLLARFPSSEDSTSAVKTLYQQYQFEITHEEDHIPWLFFKHSRQMEYYSVHLMVARKGGQSS